MKNIRNKVFETNSSSSHSISIYNATNGLYDTITPDEDGIITLTGGKFNWEWEKYNDALTKANYAAVFAMGDQQMTDMLVEVIKEHTGAKDVQILCSEDYKNPNHSYIDHQSARSEGGDAGKAFDTPATLKNFIFHPESWLFTGNDNDTAPLNFYDVEFGIIYTHELSIDGIAQSIKLQDLPDEVNLKEHLANIAKYHSIFKNYRYTLPQDRWSFVPWDQISYNGKHFSSFDKIKEGKVIFYKTKMQYSKNKYQGEKILGTKEYNFQIKKL